VIVMNSDDTLALMAIAATIKKSVVDLLHSEMSRLNDSKNVELHVLKQNIETSLHELFVNMQDEIMRSVERDMKEAEDYLLEDEKHNMKSDESLLAVFTARYNSFLLSIENNIKEVETYLFVNDNAKENVK